jgi:gliding motility-associated-like protein
MASIFKFLLSFLLLAVCGISQGQNIIISNGETTACSGALVDDGDGGAYLDNDYTFTICSDSPGDVVQVEFVAFGLQTSPNPNNSDYLAIYDGDDTSANSLGSYAGTGLQGIAVTGTINNVSGCLTFVFTCNTGNTSGAPGFEALISCTTPCDSPTSLGQIADPAPEGIEQIIGVCMGQEVTFGDEGSVPGAGFTIANYIWNYGDGTIDEGSNLTDPTHFYNEPGEYIATLTVQDNNGCFSLNLDPMQILVSTIPIFNTEFDEVVCLGGEGSLNGNPVQNVTWTALPPQVVAGESYLADGAGFSYTSELTFDFFEAGATLDNCDDLFSIFVNMEHSYLGDLGMYIECPNGTLVNLIDWGMNGGGGTFLGECVDDGTTIAGTGYDYGWQPGLTNGNLDDNNSTSVSYVNNAGQLVTGNIVDPGFYESDEDICNLVGCPLNGTWSFGVTDNLAIDNGYIFEWGMEFNPDLYPGITTFTPVVGLESDSSWWEGPFIISISSDGNSIEIEPPALGFYEYTFFATNNFSCTFDTTITIEVVPGPVVDAGLDETLCGDLELEAVILSNDFPAPPCEFIIEMYNDNNNYGWDGGNIGVTAGGVFQGNFTTFNESSEQIIAITSGEVLIISYINSPWGATTGNAFNIFDDAGNLVFSSADDPADGIVFDESVLCTGDGQIQYEWTPAENLDDPNSPSPVVVQVNGETVFEVTAYPAGFPGCASTDFVTITPAFLFNVNSQNPSCAGNDGFVHVFIDDGTGTPPWTIELYEGGGIVESIDINGGLQEFNDLLPGDYSVSIINDQCTYDIDVDIAQPDIITIETSADTTICIQGTAALSAWSLQDPDNSWTYIWDQGLGNGSTVFDQPLVPTTYEVYAIDDFGCESAPFTMDVDIFMELSMEIALDTLICGGGTATVEVLSISGGDSGPYNFAWSNGSVGVSSEESFTVDPNGNTTYCVVVTDGCETPEVAACQVVTLEVPLDVSIGADTTSGCFPADILFFVQNDQDSYVQGEWTISDGTYIFNASEFPHTFNEPGSYDVGLTLSSPIGCQYSDFEENYISVFDNPLANFHSSPQPTAIPETEIQYFDDSQGSIIEWFWVFDTIQMLGNAFEQNPLFEYPYDIGGNYPVSLTVIDANGCESTAMKYTVIYDLFNVYIPNAFSPNADGVNDVFLVKGSDIDLTRFELIVFDRWGEKVFQTNDIAEPWLGEVSGGQHYANTDLYEWHLTVYSASTAQRYIKQGSVTVIR